MHADTGLTNDSLVRPANILDFQFPKDNNRKHMLVLGNLADHLLDNATEENVSASAASSTMECAYPHGGPVLD